MKLNYSVAMILSNPFINDPRVLKEAKVLVDNGYQVTVFAWDRECKYPQQENRLGISIQRIQAKSGYGRGIFQALSLFLFFWRVFGRLGKSHFAIIHCHDLETLPVGLIMKRRHGCKVIFDAHEDEYWLGEQGLLRKITLKAGRILERLLVRKDIHVLTVDSFQIDKYRRLGIENLSMVANYPELGFTILDSPRNRGDDIVIGRIGTFHETIELEQILDALAILRSQYAGIRLFLAGNLSCDTQGLAGKINAMRTNTEFIPAYEHVELPGLYARLDICLLPYSPRLYPFPGFTPTKFFEALFFGVPVIVGDVGALGKIVREENCGMVLEPVSAEGIVAGVKYLIDHPELRKKMGDNGQRAIKEKYNWNISAARLLSVYESLERLIV